MRRFREIREITEVKLNNTLVDNGGTASQATIIGAIAEGNKRGFDDEEQGCKKQLIIESIETSLKPRTFLKSIKAE